MGLVIKTGEIATQGSTLSTAISKQATNISAMKSNIDAYGQAGGLEGKAWGDNKAFFEETHSAFLQILKNANEALDNAHKRFKAGTGDEDLDEDQLMEELAQYDNLLGQVGGQIVILMDVIAQAAEGATTATQTELNNAYDKQVENNALRKGIQKKLDELRQRNRDTAHMMDYVNNLQNDIEDGINKIKNAWTTNGFEEDLNKKKWFKRLDSSAKYAEAVQLELVKVKNDGSIKVIRETVVHLSNKSVTKMSKYELEQYNMMIDLILTQNIGEENLTIIIESYYTPRSELTGYCHAKETADELVLSIDAYLMGMGEAGFLNLKQYQRGMLIASALSAQQVMEVGKVKYENETYYFHYTEGADPHGLGYATTAVVPERVIEIGPAGFRDIGGAKMVEDTDTLYGYVLGFSVSDEAKGIVEKQARELIKDRIAKEVGSKAATKVMGRAMQGVDIAMGIIEDYLDASEGEEIAKLNDGNQLMEKLDLCYVSAINGDSHKYRRKIYPGPNTQEMIDRCNKKLNLKEEDKITMKDVAEHPGKVWEKIQELDMDEIQRELRAEGKWVEYE